MKRLSVIVTAIFLTMSLTGCEAVQKKFTRKKKEVKTPRFYQLKKYTKKPSPELYKQHYAYWESWQEELVQFVGQNRKKDERAIDEAIGHLKDMQNILVPSKAEAMQPHVERMESARTMIFDGELSSANKDYVRSNIDREDRAIRRDFCYDRVKNDLRKSFDEEEAPKLSMTAGKEVPVESQN